ncbi:MAG: trypsin-like peptidase domain-containing protein [Chloroflexi bacterium]|nr:trypsin-like peptidase domain-containing protein [Chloroflexota bacterium]
MSLSFLKSRRLWAVALPVAMALAVACSGALAPATPSPTAPPAPDEAAPTSFVEPSQNGEAAASPTASDNSTPAAVSDSPTAQAEPPASSGLPALQELDASEIVAAYEQALNAIYENVLPSVVHIRVQIGQGVFGGSAQAEGSGFVWDDQGHIVTNQHVVDNATAVTVIFPDGTQAPAEVLGEDVDSDLAVIKVNLPASDLTPVVVGDSDAVRPGHLAVAIGNPFGQEFTLTSGIVSAVGRTINSGNSPYSIPEAIQTDAAINPGNSGGPLLDRLGRVIGINTQIISQSGSNSGVGFAVPVNIAKRVVPALIEDGTYEYAYLGISSPTGSGNLPASTPGALISDVTANGPAARAGVRLNDVIVSVDGTPVQGMDDLISYMVKNTSPGDTIAVEVVRNGQRIPVNITLGTRP